MARRVRAARVKVHRNYTIEQAAETVGVTPQTVRSWIKQGLPVMAARRPYQILGCALREFLARTEADRKQPLRIGEFFCLRCKTARPPALGMMDYSPLSPSHGRLSAFCAECEGPCGRVVSAARLPEWSAAYTVGGNNAGRD
jgi:hypothetical protein